jgi:hypothetical protein
VFKPKLEEGIEQIAGGFSDIYKLVLTGIREHLSLGWKIGAFIGTISGFPG